MIQAMYNFGIVPTSIQALPNQVHICSNNNNNNQSSNQHHHRNTTKLFSKATTNPRGGIRQPFSPIVNFTPFLPHDRRSAQLPIPWPTSRQYPITNIAPHSVYCPRRPAVLRRPLRRQWTPTEVASNLGTKNSQTVESFSCRMIRKRPPDDQGKCFIIYILNNTFWVYVVVSVSFIHSNIQLMLFQTLFLNFIFINYYIYRANTNKLSIRFCDELADNFEYILLFWFKFNCF